MTGRRQYKRVGTNRAPQHALPQYLHCYTFSAKIYYVIHSANTHGGLRERKRAATRASITAIARSLTSEHGLSGYTVEEVCERAGISRRTFFNYFPSKEDAIIGHVDDDFPEEFVSRFIAGGAGSPAGTISPSLLSDLVKLSLELSERMSSSEEETRQLIGVIQKEPQLMLRIIGASEEREAEFARMLAAREGVPSDHPVVRMAVALLGSIARKTSAGYFSAGNTRPYREMLLENVEAARALLSQSLDIFPSHPSEGSQ